ncbi:hypothetical protein PFISCL1PPCAC_1574, partial [Pristionchus fissidentatus]
SNQLKETLSNCFGVIKSSPPLLNVLIYCEFYCAFLILIFAIVGFSMGAQTLPLLLMAALQTVIAVPGYLYMMWNEPKYLLCFAVIQLAAFSTEFVWMIVMCGQTGFSEKSGLLLFLSILQCANVLVAFFFRDLRVDFCCCGKNRRASGNNSVSLEGVTRGGLTPPPANWAKTKPVPTLSTSEKDSAKTQKSSRKSTIMNPLNRKKEVDFDVEKNQNKKPTVHSPLEKNIFGGISEEEKKRSIQKKLSRMAVSTPSRSMTRSSDEVRVEPELPKGKAVMPVKSQSKEDSRDNSRTSTESL